ncbi:MAG: molybdopterin molybdotransferase MoeA [Actinobacteria bacterium]|nr:molybdopterin molybdotransferase MoeA [Actinomycetota bacterium]
MIDWTEAKETILNAAERLQPIEVDILDSLDMVLAEDAAADIDIPPFDNSAMDGYAILSSDTASISEDNPPCALNIIDSQPAGSFTDKTVISGTAIKIMTGAIVPKGADSVIMVENTQPVDENKVIVLKPVRRGENVRYKGEDIKKNEIVLKAGSVIGSSQISILASLGKSRVKVYRRPKVAVIGTGDELVDLTDPLLPGKIRDSNTYSITACVKSTGGNTVRIGIIKDKWDNVREAIEMALECDVVITTGGVSVGEYDVVKNVIEDLKADLKFWKVAQKPGKPFAFWALDKKLIFGLPGNPGAAMVCFEAYVRPALLKMMGRTKFNKPEVDAILTHDFKKKAGRLNFVNILVEHRDGEYYATTCGSKKMGPIKSMAYSNGLALIPKEVSFVKAGEKVRVQLIEEKERM